MLALSALSIPRLLVVQHCFMTASKQHFSDFFTASLGVPFWDYGGRHCEFSITCGCNVQAAAASAVAGEDAEQQGEQAEGEPVRKRARGRPLGSKTKVPPAAHYLQTHDEPIIACCRVETPHHGAQPVCGGLRGPITVALHAAAAAARTGMTCSKRASGPTFRSQSMGPDLEMCRCAMLMRCVMVQARPEDMLEPAETPEEATRRMLDAKKLSSKINYNVLANLFSETSRSDQ